MQNNIKFLTITQDGAARTAQVEGSPTLLEALAAEGCFVSAPCSGDGRCGSCGVYARGQLSPPDERELELCGGCPADGEGYSLRLACRARMEGDCSVRLTTGSAAHKQDGELPDCLPGDFDAPFALAVDLGTTTVAMRAVELESGGAVAQGCAGSDQRVCGADVVTRIAFCSRPDGLLTLHRLAFSQLNRMLGQLGGGRLPEYMVIAGNTVMLHLLACIDPTYLGQAPYRTRERFGRWYEPRVIGLPVRAWLMPCIGGYTGGDLTAALLALTAAKGGAAEGLALCDLGTNGEMAVFDGARWLAASAAAGPALEGGGISCGSGGVTGAVTSVVPLKDSPDENTLPRGENKRTVLLSCGEDPDRYLVSCRVIGGGEPLSLTGSGLIALTASLLEKGKIAPTGFMEAEEWQLGSITCTRGDVRQLQLAKGAVAAALLRLCEEYCDIKKSNSKNDCLHIDLTVTGGLGCTVDPSCAAAIGLTPCPEGCTMAVDFLPNLALEGARLCLSEDGRRKAIRLAEEAQVLELTGDSRFDSLFIGCMRLGEPEKDFL